MPVPEKGRLANFVSGLLTPKRKNPEHTRLRGELPFVVGRMVRLRFENIVVQDLRWLFPLVRPSMQAAPRRAQEDAVTVELIGLTPWPLLLGRVGFYIGNCSRIEAEESWRTTGGNHGNSVS
jgi:hypothetical protein